MLIVQTLSLFYIYTHTQRRETFKKKNLLFVIFIEKRKAHRNDEFIEMNFHQVSKNVKKTPSGHVGMSTILLLYSMADSVTCVDKKTHWAVACVSLTVNLLHYNTLP